MFDSGSFGWLTLGRVLQIELIWPTKMSMMKFVYLVNKYSVLMDIFFMVFGQCGSQVL